MKYFEMNKNETQHIKTCRTERDIYCTKNPCQRRRSQVSDFRVHCKKPEKGQIRPKISRKKDNSKKQKSTRYKNQ